MASGRKLAFDVESALDEAMHTFWKKGYAGTSMSDLVQSMGINKPSIYRTYGNKECLFIKTTHRYIAQKMQPHIALLYAENKSLKQRLKNHLMSILNMQCQTEHAFGCYLVLCQSELISGEIPPQAAQLLASADLIPQQLYTELFNNDAQAVALGLNRNAESNALCLYTLLKGSAAMARSGAQLDHLEYAIDRMLEGIGLNC